MKAQKQQLVTIKGTKDGLTLFLDDVCSFDQLLKDLEEMLSLKQYVQENGPVTGVIVKAGNRLLKEEQQELLIAAIQKKRSLKVETIETNVMTKEEAYQLVRETEIVSVAKIVRSGQILRAEGDLLLIGDVNPGGTVIANGNIFILGSLKGIAHAGYSGNREAVIAASYMSPAQLRIGDALNRPDHISSEKHEMECAYIDDEGQIQIDRLQQLSHIRPKITRLKGGM